jgi:hypothetical protein
MTEDKEKTRSAVQGWRSMQTGERESRRERLIRERHEASQGDNTKDLAKKKKQAVLEAQKMAEQEPENPMRHLKEAYKKKQQVEAQKKRVILSPDMAIQKCALISENGGVICEVNERGLNYEVVYVL